MSISETVSETPKRGRPRASVRQLLRAGDPLEGCDRTRVNRAYRGVAMGVFLDLDEIAQRTVWGCTGAELMSGAKCLPPGWDTAAEEIGRFIESRQLDVEEEHEYAAVVVRARQSGVVWADIRAHFRALRLGSREGNATSLLAELARTIDAYKLRFPATPDAVVVGAVRSLLDIVDPEAVT